jgi:hypothetical protein
MIRKNITLALMGISLTTACFANSVTTVVNPAGFVNLLAGFNQSVQVSQIVIAANSTNASALLIDSPTNSLTYINAAYSNTVSYATNYVSTSTNYYGVATSLTNIALVDVSNTLVPATTNNYPVRLGVATIAGTSAKYDGVNYYFNNGLWATNTSSGIATITVTYK